ncbi:hypothetical protein FBQ85_27705 [Cytophagia bacterium CHB2]|nr:hypothetical protein [Cytophagia bacterium CHB2]
MKRFITTLTVLAVMVLLGCEKYESPVAPPQEQQVQSTSTLDSKASLSKLKEKIEAGKTQIAERAAALKMQAAKKRQNHVPQIAASGKITVPSSGFPTIQSAVDAAAPGTKIIVKNGTYTEEVVVFTDNLTITAAKKGQAHLIGGFVVSGVTKGKIEGFDITGTVFLEECIQVEVKDNEVKEGAGITLFGSVSCQVKDNVVHDILDIGLFAPTGISIYFGGKHLVKDNVAHTNIVGILVLGGLEGDTNPSAGKNVISSNECNGNQAGIVLYGSHENDLGDNECNSNLLVGIYLLLGSDRNKIGSNNKADINGEYGILLEAGSDNNTFKKNRARGNGNCDLNNHGTGNTFTQNNFGSVCS